MSTIVQNRKSHHDYEVLEKVEAGIALVGTEVKSCRDHSVSLADAYARMTDGELWLVGVHIAPYAQGNRNNHDPRRDRKLLLHKHEIRRLAQAIEAKGLTLVPLRFYLLRNRVKVELGLCRGKNVRDKRDTLRKKMDDMETRRAIRSHSSA
ncbi:MAG: SsrA-binding protein [Lentisphaerae bacterium RIFOXYA12_64_32]|nr:MAG: SsrA-binding protein [Lentisphaerae bacterium RIFOXYA12_64_32]